MTSPDDQKRFDTLILPNRAALTARARRLAGGDLAEAEDMVQEALLRAYTHMDSLTCEDTVKGWLYTTLRNVFLNRYKQAMRTRAFAGWEINEDILIPIAQSRPETPEGAVLQRSEYHASLGAIEALPSYYREPLILAVFEDMSYQDISEKLGIPLGTVRTRIARGRNRIRRAMYSWTSSS